MVKHIFDRFFSFSELPEIRTVEGLSAVVFVIRCEHRLCSQTVCVTPQVRHQAVLIIRTGGKSVKRKNPRKTKEFGLTGRGKYGILLIVKNRSLSAMP